MLTPWLSHGANGVEFLDGKIEPGRRHIGEFRIGCGQGRFALGCGSTFEMINEGEGGLAGMSAWP